MKLSFLFLLFFLFSGAQQNDSIKMNTYMKKVDSIYSVYKISDPDLLLMQSDRDGIDEYLGQFILTSDYYTKAKKIVALETDYPKVYNWGALVKKSDEEINKLRNSILKACNASINAHKLYFLAFFNRKIDELKTNDEYSVLKKNGYDVLEFSKYSNEKKDEILDNLYKTENINRNDKSRLKIDTVDIDDILERVRDKIRSK